MSYQTVSRGDLDNKNITMNIFKDGYVRLKPENFKITLLFHLVSGLDEVSSVTSQVDGSLARISGYTEWLTSTKPVITLDWDWLLSVSLRKGVYVRGVGAPRSNIMFIDDMQRDLGYERTSTLLEAEIDALEWSEVVQKNIVNRYV